LLAALTQAFGIDDALGGIRKSRAETISVSADPSFATCWLAPHLSMFYAITLNADVVLNADMRLVDFGNDGTTLAIRYAKERSNWPRTEARKLCDVRLSAYLSPALTESVDLNAPSDLCPCLGFTRIAATIGDSGLTLPVQRLPSRSAAPCSMTAR
jgi:LysR family transcriptional regulator, glycine cleavage system transcriptional activator